LKLSVLSFQFSVNRLSFNSKLKTQNSKLSFVPLWLEKETVRPVMQTKFERQGNCFAAAAASILELPINHVPRKRGEGWLERWREWLKGRGLSIEWYGCEGRRPPRGWSILTIEGGYRGGHAVVCFDGRVVHDPKDADPKRALRARQIHWYVFTMLDPSKGGG
jgi:hypothetical protein